MSWGTGCQLVGTWDGKPPFTTSLQCLTAIRKPIPLISTNPHGVVGLCTRPTFRAIVVTQVSGRGNVRVYARGSIPVCDLINFFFRLFSFFSSVGQVYIYSIRHNQLTIYSFTRCVYLASGQQMLTDMTDMLPIFISLRLLHSPEHRYRLPSVSSGARPIL